MLFKIPFPVDVYYFTHFIRLCKSKKLVCHSAIEPIQIGYRYDRSPIIRVKLVKQFIRQDIGHAIRIITHNGRYTLTHVDIGHAIAFNS